MLPGLLGKVIACSERNNATVSLRSARGDGMDLEQKLEGPWAWGFAVVMCLLIVGAMFVGASFNRMPTPPPTVSSDIAATQGEAPPPARGAEAGVPSGSS